MILIKKKKIVIFITHYGINSYIDKIKEKIGEEEGDVLIQYIIVIFYIIMI